MFDYVIKNGTIVTSADTYVADIGIVGEKIIMIGKEFPADEVNDAEIIDASGKYVFPGGIDVHTHFALPVGGTVSKDDFQTGTIAAACGGTTTIIDFCTQEKGQTLHDALIARHKEAKDKVAIDYGLHIAITDVNEATLREIPEVIKQGYPSFKLYMVYDTARVEDDELLQVLMQTREHGGIVNVHAENHLVIKYLTEKFKREGKIEPIYHALSRPPFVEGEATGRVIKLAMQVDAPLYIVHVTCNESLKEIARARKLNAKVMAETCPQYLLLSEDNYHEPDFQGAKYVISPPLRPKENQEYLWQGLVHEQLQVVSTDHCPFDFKGQKDRGRDFFGNIPNGSAGVEARLMLLFDRGVNSGKISLNRFVAITATNPAKIFGMYPEKGTIAVGGDADLVIFDPTIQKTISKKILHENVDHTIYEGFKITGYPIMTFSRGKIVARNGEFIGKVGAGKFIARRKPMVI